MKPEALGRIAQDLRWRVGLLVFAVLGSVGGACVLWALQDVRSSGARIAGKQAGALAQSVAQTLALQLGRAVRQGTPLQAQPAMASELAAALRRHAALAHLAVETPSGAVLHAVGDPPRTAAAHVVRTPIAAGEGGARAGTVVVTVDPGHALQRPLRGLRWQAAGLVLLVACATALACAFGPGARMERQRRQVLHRLAAPAQAGTDAPRPGPAGGGADDAGHGLAALAQALAQGDAQVQAARRAVDDYAQELIAMDFDGRVRPKIDCVLRAQAGGPQP